MNESTAFTTLRTFRHALYGCFERRADALMELTTQASERANEDRLRARERMARLRRRRKDEEITRQALWPIVF